MLQKQRNPKLNGHGLFGTLMIISMFVIAYVLQWNIPWLYFVLALTLYGAAVLILTSQGEIDTVTSKLLLGFHLALMFLAVGLLIRFPSHTLIYTLNVDSAYRFGYFIASILGGLTIPFLIYEKVRGEYTFILHGLLAFLLIAVMFGIAFYYQWDIPWLYFIGAIILYALFNVVSNQQTEAIDGRFRLGYHLAFIFLLVGFWLHSNNDTVYTGFFIGGIAGGIAIPFLLIR
jgi:hypothetical protein